MKGLIRFIQVILTIVWLALLALSVTLYMSSNENELPGISQWKGFAVTDNGMEPELSPGDLAVIGMGDTPKAGDIVLCRDGSGDLTITRIIGTSEGQLILKSDSLDNSRLAAADEVLGVSVGYAQGLGEPLRFLCSLTGVIVIAAAGLLLVVLPGFMLRTPKPRPVQTNSPERPQRPRQGGYTPRH